MIEEEAKARAGRLSSKPLGGIAFYQWALRDRRIDYSLKFELSNHP